MQKYIYIIIGLFSLLVSCNDSSVIKIQNAKEGKLQSVYQLIVKDIKRFALDSVTAPKPLYTQLLRDSDNNQMLTFLNQYKRTIYFYRYDNMKYSGEIVYNKNDIPNPAGYYIKNMDSIYIYEKSKVKLVLADSCGKIKQQISLHDESLDWHLHYPQYMLSTINSITEYNNKLIMSGFYFQSIPASIINEFCFSSIIDMQTNKVKFSYKYPKDLYGNGANWEGGLSTAVYAELTPNGEMVHSFPVSHNLYISEWEAEEYATTYGGSNVAKTIQSIDYKDFDKTPTELIFTHHLQEDMYTAIQYDPFRKVYYRFMLQGIPDAIFNTPKEKKPIIIIIMDEKFNYLGETLIGTGEEWNWTNTFVTEEGLNIEYIEKDANEDYLTFKIFTLEKIIK